MNLHGPQTELGWKEAIIKVLGASDAPMHYVEIAQQIYERSLRTEQTVTPAATVASTLAQSFKNDGEQSSFIRVSRGVYALRSVQQEAPVVAQKELAATESSEVTGLVNAFGMFWERAKVQWEKPQILGQQAGSEPVDFRDQRGVYLLHDSQGVVYVGRPQIRVWASGSSNTRITATLAAGLGFHGLASILSKRTGR